VTARQLAEALGVPHAAATLDLLRLYRHAELTRCVEPGLLERGGKWVYVYSPSRKGIERLRWLRNR